MRYPLLFFGLTLCSFAFSQSEFETVNRDAVKKAVSDNAAESRYPKLLARFLNDDYTLTNNDFRLLYYGFVFQDGYSGFPDLKQTEIRDALSKKDYDLAIKLCDTVLKKYPINLSGNYNKSLALYRKNKEDAEFIKYRNRYNNIVNAIISSGNGLSCVTAFKTIFGNDEYYIMYNYFEIEKFQGQSLELPCDKMKISPSPLFKSEYIFFDTSETFAAMQQLFDKK